MRLKLKYVKLLSSFALKLNLRRYSVALLAFDVDNFLPGTARYVVKQLPTLGNNAVAGRACQIMLATSSSTLWTLIT